MNDYIDEILYELNLSQLTPVRISTNRLHIDKPTILLTIPDTNITLQSSIYTAGMLINNCDGIVTKNVNQRIGRKTYNGKVRLLDLKKYFIATKQDGGKKLRVLTTIPKLKDNNNSNDYYFYDLGLYTESLKDMMEIYPLKTVGKFLFDQLSTIYKTIKTSNPLYRIEVLFLCKDNKGLLYEILKNIRIILPEDEISDMDFYDNYLLGSNINNVIVPLLYRQKLKSEYKITNIQKFMNYLDSASEAEALNHTNLIDEKNTNELTKEPKNNIFTKIADNLKTNRLKTSVSEDGTVNIGIDNNKLITSLSKYNIKDPDIVANVKASLDNYIKIKGEKLNTDEAESAILKAINYTLHGKDEIDDEYIANPNKLISKLSQIRTHKTPLKFPHDGASIIDPNEVIDIDYTTGVWRQKQEFESTIHTNVKKLFDSLESVSVAPIKIKKIEHKVIDDEQNRLYKYTITLQNTMGGSKEPYSVELNVPAPVNNRYFKLRGSQYIMAAQQFFKPITKTEKNEVRILSNYAIVRLQLQNVKFNSANIDDLINYVELRYPLLIKENIDNTKYVFNDGSTIYLIGDKVYEKDDYVINLDNDTGRLKDKDGKFLSIGKCEFLYDKIRNLIMNTNPEDRLTKTKKSIPYFQFYIGGIKLPLIMYLWQLQGLIKTLSDFGIEYRISESPDPSDIIIKMSGSKYLVMYPSTFRQRLLCNGLLAAKIKDEITDLNDPARIYPFIEKTYGARTILQLRIMTQNMIDPITREILQYENLSTNLPNLVSTRCIDMLLNQKPDKVSDLKLYRARMSEIILNIMYKQLMMAHNTYHQKVEEFNDPNAKLVIMPDYILNDIITTAGVLQYTEAANPVDEIGLASRTIKTGPGGVPNHRAFKIEHRNIHPSQYGIMSAVMTPEHGSVGLVVSHTLTPVIVNELGSYGIKDLDSMKKYGTLSINEALVPFQNEMD